MKKERIEGKRFLGGVYISSNQIKELDFIRFIACFSVVMIHTLHRTIYGREVWNQELNHMLMVIQLSLMFATPLFVLVSEMITAHSTKNCIPKGFLWRKIKFIIVPYFIMSIIYAIDKTFSTSNINQGFFEIWRLYLIGQWHGYFVLIICQMYLLHIFFVKYFYDSNPAILLTYTGLLSMGYWLMFDLYVPNVPSSKYSWEILLRIPFLGWLFYFTMAFYAGKNIDQFRSFIYRYRKYMYLNLFITFCVVHILFYNGIIHMVSSARYDVVLYTVFIFIGLFLFSRYWIDTPYSIKLVCSCSYGIYLLHPLVQKYVAIYIYRFQLSTLWYIVSMQILGIGIPVCIVLLCHKYWWGKYLVGKVRVPLKYKNN
ncbi:acyltransferase family protein (plasmid) [Bacillus cereus]|uniref:acyltransferase family protein n=1 Tax=Bacillus cereus TaxID=1396 RepID=UPI001F47CA62|nr:acyltransferase family protein [Bacillus cereus]UIJ69733.1 acyltransferase family protein [Bacillus cereus]